MKMTGEQRGLRTTSPVHVHVEDDTPIHVHVARPILKKSSTESRVDARLHDSKSRLASEFGASNLRTSRSKRSTTAVSRRKSPTGGPWVPPPGRSTKGTKISWKGNTHTLEITPRDDRPSSTMRVSDLDTDEEDRVIGHRNQYEKKISSLMSEVGSLKNEVELQNTLREIDKKDDQISASHHAMQEQEDELQDYKRELTSTETENLILRRSMERMKGDLANTRSEKNLLEEERELLMKKLVEVEMDGQGVMRQVQDMRDLVKHLREERKLPSSDSAALARQKELLTEKLTDYEVSNRTLRRLLRDQHQQEANGLRLGEQRDILLKKLAESDGNIQRLHNQRYEHEKLEMDLKSQLAVQKDENVAISNLQSSIEQTRAHLQKQLRSKEADCNRMAVQIRGLESQLTQEKIEVDHLQELLGAAKNKSERDKEALKKATRVQKERATRSENIVDKLNSQLLEQETMTAEIKNQYDEEHVKLDKVIKEKSHAITDNSALRNRIADLENKIEELQVNSEAQMETVTSKLEHKTSDLSTARLENGILKNSITSLEDRLQQANSDISTLRTSVQEYERLIEDYRQKSDKSQREVNEMSFRYEEQQKENSRIQIEGDIELDKVRKRLQQRLQELEPLPELLKTTELKYQDAQERISLYEQRNAEHTKLISDLTTKVEQQTEEIERLREKFTFEVDSNRSVQGKVESLERRQHELEERNHELTIALAKREDAISQNNLRLEEYSQEKASLSRQLENTLADARKREDEIRERMVSKERSMQARTLDLESQLSQMRAEVARIKREKEEEERKFNSRLYDLKDRLEQSHSTNRSMQNYVQFLKSSYSNVFGDTTLSPLRASLQ